MFRPKGYAADYFTLRSTYFQGRPPASVNMHWRRFAISSIPTDDPEAFQKWLLDRWREKDKLLEAYYTTGRFPAATSRGAGKALSERTYVETQVKLRSPIEILQIFMVLLTLALLANVVEKLFRMFLSQAA